VLICEYLTGGAMAGSPWPAPMAAQGFAMAVAALRAFGACGCQTIVLHDPRVRPDALPADHHVPVEPGRFHRRLRETLGAVDAALLIAPESGGVLAALADEVDRAGVLSLGADAAPVRLAADKLRLMRVLAAADVPVPRTVAVPLDAVPAAVRLVGFPAVVKPRTGAGGEGVGVVRRPTDLGPALARLRRAVPGTRGCLVQEWIPGVPASVSLIGNGRKARPITLNRQLVQGPVALTYGGGIVPYRHRQRQAAFARAAAACAAIPGLRGHVGVDVVLGPRGPVVIEVNPRWTTSCVGLERLLGGTLGAWILAAAHRGTVPGRARVTGTAHLHLAALQQRLVRACRGGQDPTRARKGT